MINNCFLHFSEASPLWSILLYCFTALLLYCSTVLLLYYPCLLVSSFANECAITIFSKLYIHYLVRAPTRKRSLITFPSFLPSV